MRLAAARGFRWAGPAMVCARKRRHQVAAMVRDLDQLRWLCEQWRAKDIFRSILSHKLRPEALGALTPAEKYARRYGYGVRDHFRDTGSCKRQPRGGNERRRLLCHSLQRRVRTLDR